MKIHFSRLIFKISAAMLLAASSCGGQVDESADTPDADLGALSAEQRMCIPTLKFCGVTTWGTATCCAKGSHCGEDSAGEPRCVRDPLVVRR